MNEKVVLNFTGVVATPSSFFEEVFGGLVRIMLSKSEVATKIGIPLDVANKPSELVSVLKGRIKLVSDERFIQKKLERVIGYMDVALGLIEGSGH